MYAQVNDTQIFFERLGKGRPFFLMHGPGLDQTYFRPWLDRLNDELELVYYDHRGHGRSTRPPTMEGTSLETLAADADALRAHLGLDQIIVFAHSYGSFIATEYAVRFSRNLAGLILCDTAPTLEYMPVVQANAAARGAPEALAALNEFSGRALRDEEDFRFLWMRMLPLYFKRYDPQVASSMDYATSYSAAGWNHFSDNCLPNTNIWPQLEEISVPTLVLTGADDWISPAELGTRIHASLRNAQQVRFEESGHFPFIEETDRFVTTVRHWIAAL